MATITPRWWKRLWYKERGYDFLSFSDHNTIMDHERWINGHRNLGGRVALDKLKARFPEGWIEERVDESGKLEVRLKTFDEVRAKIGSPGKFLIIQGEGDQRPFSLHSRAHERHEPGFGHPSHGRRERL